MYLNALNISPAEYQHWYATGQPPKRYAYLNSHNQGAPEDLFTKTSAPQDDHTSHLTLGSLFKTALYGGLSYFALRHFAPQTFGTLASVAQSGTNTALKYASLLFDKAKTLI